MDCLGRAVATFAFGGDVEDDMSDIVESLCFLPLVHSLPVGVADVTSDAATEITRLRETVKNLRESARLAVHYHAKEFADVKAERDEARAELAQAMQERSRAIAVGSDMEQEVERLREQLHLAEVARAAQVEGLTAGLDALRVDAERYRWLLENHAIELVVIAWRYPAAVVFSTPNSAIDAARKGGT